jgi:hypothetical protein
MSLLDRIGRRRGTSTSLQLSDVGTIEEAFRRLAEHTDASGLVGTAAPQNFRFVVPRG